MLRSALQDERLKHKGKAKIKQDLMHLTLTDPRDLLLGGSFAHGDDILEGLITLSHICSPSCI